MQNPTTAAERLRGLFFKFIEHPFTRNVSVLQIGGVFSTAVGFVTSLLFARILGPEQFGFYVLVFALAGIINIFQEVGIGQGTINLLSKAYARKEREEVADVLASFAKISVFILLTAGLLGAIAAPFIGQIFYNNLYLGKLASMVVLTSAVTLFFPLVTIVFQVVQKIKVLVILESVNKVVMGVIPITLLLLGWGVLGITAGQLAAVLIMSAASIVLYKGFADKNVFFPTLKELFTRTVSFAKIKSFFRFGFEIAINKNLLKLNTTVPLLLLAYFLPTNSGLAFYKVALGYVSLPIMLLGPVSRLLNVQFPKTELAGEEKLFRRFFQVSYLSFFITLLLVIPMVLAGPYLVRFFYGVAYEPSVGMIYALAAYPLFISFGVGLGPMFRTLNKMKIAVIINFTALLALIPTSYWLVKDYSIRGLIITTLIFSIFPTVLSFLYFYKNKKFKSPHR